MNKDLNFASSAAYFEAKYQEKSDPWDFANDDYEQARYDAIVGALSHRRYRQAFEPGCSIGVLTERLAGLCDAVYAIDFSATATMDAQRRCAHLSNVEVQCAALAEGTPAKTADLLVLSEIGYYFDAERWQRLSSALIDSLLPGATVLAAHWLGHSSDHRIAGDTVHEILTSNLKLKVEYTERNQPMRLDRMVRL